jgi:translation initiation factor 2 gamma subunit (eIF-2gamma)
MKLHGYPLNKQHQAIETSLKQTELLAEDKRKNKAAENPMRGIKSAIVPNSKIVPVLIRKRVNIDGIIAANSEELSKKQPLCLTREFHVDALRAQHEYRALGRPCGRKLMEQK